MNHAATAAHRRILREGAYVLAGKILTAAGAVLGTRLLTEVVPPRVFGSVALLAGAGTLLRTFFCAPLVQAAQRLYPEEPEGVLHATAAQANRRVLTALCPVVVLLGVLLDAPLAALLLTLLLAAEAVRGLDLGLLLAARRQRRAAAWQAAEAWARPLFAVLLVMLLGPSAETILLAFALATALTLWAGRTTTPSEPVSRALRTSLRRYAIPLAPLALLGWVSSVGDRYILGGTVGLEAAGIYAACYALVSRPFLLAFGVLEQTLRPVYFDAVAKGDANVAEGTFALWCRGVWAMGVLGVGVVSAGSALLARLLLAEPFREGAALMPWIALGHLALLVAYLYEARLYAMKRTRALLAAQTIGAVAALGITIPLVRAYGLAGAAMATPLYFGVQALFTALLARLGEARAAPAGAGPPDPRIEP